MTYQFITLENGKQRARLLSVGDGRPKENFSFGDATPATIFTTQAGQIIYSVTIVIQMPFNGASPSLRVGTSGNLSLLMAATQNNPLEAGTYEVNPSILFASATGILLSIVPGLGCTQGNGTVILEV